MSPRGLPDRWMDYSPMGDVIKGTRFVCMKVPLKPSLLQSVSEDSVFSCEHAIDMVAKKGRTLGLVIDLTFTRRYYNPSCFEKENIRFKKIFMPGRVIPEESILQEFYKTVDDFEEDNQANNNVIAVHCTHGLNRTGYMVCKYLIERKGIDANIAISMFEEARGHKMEREIYLSDLKGEAVSSTKDKNANERCQAQSSIDRYQASDFVMNPTHLQSYSNHRYHDRFNDYNAPFYHQDYYRHAEQSYWNNDHHMRPPSRQQMNDNGYGLNVYSHMQSPLHHRSYNHGYGGDRYRYTPAPAQSWRDNGEANPSYGRWPLPWESQPMPVHDDLRYRSKRLSKPRDRIYDRP